MHAPAGTTSEWNKYGGIIMPGGTMSVVLLARVCAIALKVGTGLLIMGVMVAALLA